MSTETKEKETPKERKFSDEKDKKGQDHPLCMNCGHREDMHHEWNYFKIPETRKDNQGNTFTVYVDHKEVKLDGKKPCQHACKCQEYK